MISFESGWLLMMPIWKTLESSQKTLPWNKFREIKVTELPRVMVRDHSKQHPAHCNKKKDLTNEN